MALQTLQRTARLAHGLSLFVAALVLGCQGMINFLKEPDQQDGDEEE